MQAMFAICAANTGFTPSGVESLHSFEVFTVDVSFTKLQPFKAFIATFRFWV
jgi:hypothetical protein